MARSTAVNSAFNGSLNAGVSIGGASAVLASVVGIDWPSSGTFAVQVGADITTDGEIVQVTRSGANLTLSATFAKAHSAADPVYYMWDATDAGNKANLDATNTFALAQTFSGLITASAGATIKAPFILGESFNYLSAATPPALTVAIASTTATSCTVDDTNGFFTGGSGLGTDGTPLKFPISARIADGVNTEHITVLGVTSGGGTATCVLNIRKGLGGSTRRTWAVGATQVYPNFGDQEMIPWTNGPIHTCVDQSAGGAWTVYLGPKSTIVASLWTVPTSGVKQEIKLIGGAGAVVTLKMPTSATASTSLFTVTLDGNGNGGIDVSYSATAITWGSVGALGA